MRQSGVDTLITEEPDDRIGQARICGEDGQQWPSLPGILPILWHVRYSIGYGNWVVCNRTESADIHVQEAR